MISIEHLSHRFGEKLVLDDIHIEIEAASITAIMGSSGGGKTTLLKCLAGLLKPSEGKIVVDGVAVDDAEEAPFGLVFQYAALFDFLSVSENLLFGVSRQKSMTPVAKNELVDSLLRTVSLEPEVSKLKPDELSGGMRKRVGLARALAMTPKALLFDEPTSGLDPITAFSIDKLILDTRDQLGMTCIVVSHDPVSVLRLADYVLFLDGGKAAFWGTTEEFKSVKIEAVQELLTKASSLSLK